MTTTAPNRHDRTISIDSILAARQRVYQAAVRTPLVRLYYDDAPAEIYLKLESFQPIGSFKLRGAYNAISLLSPEDRAKGVWTVSAGNAAQGVAVPTDSRLGEIFVTSDGGRTWTASPIR